MDFWFFLVLWCTHMLGSTNSHSPENKYQSTEHQGFLLLCLRFREEFLHFQSWWCRKGGIGSWSQGHLLRRRQTCTFFLSGLPVSVWGCHWCTTLYPSLHDLHNNNKTLSIEDENTSMHSSTLCKLLKYKKKISLELIKMFFTFILAQIFSKWTNTLAEITYGRD